MSVFADWSALASTTVFGQVVGDFQTLSKALGLLNAFGALTKFVLSYAFLAAKIEMDAGELIRTKDTTPGDYRLLTARVRIDADRTEYLNCLRRILNQSGLDLNVPESGPVANARVSWSRPVGGAVIHRDGDPGSWWVEDELAWFDALHGNDPSSLNQFTDEAGESRIDFVGNPQRFDLSPYRVTEVNKDTVVQVSVALKGRFKRNEDGSISAAGVASEVTDLLGAALAFLTGDPVGGAVSAVTETAFQRPGTPLTGSVSRSRTGRSAPASGRA